MLCKKRKNRDGGCFPARFFASDYITLIIGWPAKAGGLVFSGLSPALIGNIHSPGSSSAFCTSLDRSVADGDDLDGAGADSVDYTIALHDFLAQIRVGVLRNHAADSGVGRDSANSAHDPPGEYRRISGGILGNVFDDGFHLPGGFGRPPYGESHFSSRRSTSS